MKIGSIVVIVGAGGRDNGRTILRKLIEEYIKLEESIKRMSLLFNTSASELEELESAARVLASTFGDSTAEVLEGILNIAQASYAECEPIDMHPGFKYYNTLKIKGKIQGHQYTRPVEVRVRNRLGGK